MPRINRGALERGFFHVLNRGNHRQQLFAKAEEYGAFLELLAHSSEHLPVKLWGYCLMPNHWHLVVEVERMEDLSKWVHGVCNRHVRKHHQQNPRQGGGHIYQGRYKSFPIEDEIYLYTVLRYVEANPLRARLVTRAEDWAWSSLSKKPIFDGLIEIARPKLATWKRDAHWLEEVNLGQSAEQLHTMRTCVLRGQPLGSESWLNTLTQGDLASTIRPRGRPRKAKSEE